MERKVVIQDPTGRIAELLGTMDGRNTLASISDDYSFDEAVSELLAYLLHTGSVAEADQLWRPFHHATENPQHFGVAMDLDDVKSHTQKHTWARDPHSNAPDGSLLNLAIRRHSCRSFSQETLSLAKASEVLKVAYAATTRATPSAGGLYSCRIDVLRRSELDSGWRAYRWDPLTESLVPHSAKLLDSGRIRHALDSASLLHGAAAVVIVSVDPRIHSAKYANRGYRYSVLEAGHVAQMVHLAATEQDIAALEWGAFNDRALALLAGSAPFAPITLVALGHASDEVRIAEPNRAALARSAFSSFGDPLDDDGHASGVVVAQIPLASADGLQPNGSATGVHWAGSLAGVKARSEFVERRACLNLRIDELGSADGLAERYRVLDVAALFPASLPAFADESSEFAPFDPSDARYQWRVGISDKHGPTIVPVELVYFPVRSSTVGRRICGSVSSNGVAAHSTIDDARTTALLELIERDAFVRHWISQRPPTRIVPPVEVFDSQLADLQRRNVKVVFGQLDAVVPVIYCAVIGDMGELHAFGLAADTSAKAAVEKCFLDAYATYLTARRATTTGTGNHVRHHLAYASPGSVSRIGWFFDGPGAALSFSVDQSAYVKLRAETTFVRLDSGSDADLIVVRALSANLRSIWFGTRWQPQDDPNGVPHFFS